jgi:putative membrane protein
MYRTITLAAALASALGIARAAAAGPTDPQIAHIAYTAGLIDISRRANRPSISRRTTTCAPSPSK